MTDEQNRKIESQLGILANIFIDHVIAISPEERAALSQKPKKEIT